LREMRRVARPGGRVVIATNSARSMWRLDEVCRQAAADVGRPPPGERRSPFVLEDLERVRQVFDDVDVREFRNVLMFPGAEPVVRYLASTGSMDSALADSLEERVRDIIQAEGAFRVETIAGCFVAEVG
jgi:ubiquinone/menaquinone biosynthesis C-methylase UbiE